MKKVFLLVLTLFILGFAGHSSPAQEKKADPPKMKVTIDKDVAVLENASDLDTTHDTIFELALKKGLKKFVVKVDPLPKRGLGFLSGNPEEPRVSARQTVLDAYIASRDRVVAEIEKSDAKLAKEMRDSADNLRLNLERVERFLGEKLKRDLVKEHKDFNPTERCRRIAWRETVPHFDIIVQSKDVNVEFEFLSQPK